jgi:hypothetical protein
VFHSTAGTSPLLLEVVYFACLAKCTYHFLYVDVSEIQAGQERCQAKSLLRTLGFDPTSTTAVDRHGSSTTSLVIGVTHFQGPTRAATIRI